MAANIPEVPTVDTNFDETKAFLEYLRDEHRSVKIRDLLGYWGKLGRGKHNVALIYDELERMGLQTNPPFDSGPLDGSIVLENISDPEVRAISGMSEQQHLLLLSRFDSASFALNEEIEGYGFGWVHQETPISEAMTVMLRHDFSQLPIVDSEETMIPVGVFSWVTIGKAKLTGSVPSKVRDAMDPIETVDLHSDLFACVNKITDEGYAIVTYRGKLAGIVTSSNLTEEFQRLAIPFLAVMRCEQEIKRVAQGYLAPSKNVENMMMGQLQKLFHDQWEKLNWGLSEPVFNEWMDSTRRLRNSIAHYDNPDDDRSKDVDSVHRLTAWLRSVTTLEQDGEGIKL